MQQQDRDSLLRFLNILEKRLGWIVTQPNLIPRQFIEQVNRAWFDVQPHFSSIREAIRSMNLERNGTAFDGYGLSGNQLALKMALIDQAEALLDEATTNPPPFWLTRQVLLPLAGGAILGLVIGMIWAAFYSSPGQSVWLELLISSVIGAGVGVLVSLKEAIAEKLRKLIELLLKPANGILGSLAAAVSHTSPPGVPNPGAIGVAAMAEGLKEFKEMIETVINHTNHHRDRGSTLEI